MLSEVFVGSYWIIYHFLILSDLTLHYTLDTDKAIKKLGQFSFWYWTRWETTFYLNHKKQDITIFKVLFVGIEIFAVSGLIWLAYRWVHVAICFSQTWDLSKIVHRWIFRPKILHPYFHRISTVLVIKTPKNENGEIYTAAKNFTLPPAVTAWQIPPLGTRSPTVGRC